MDRIETYVGQSILEWSFSKPDQNKMVALGKMISATLGNSPIVNGLPCTQQSVPTMFVNIGAGEIYQAAQLEATVCGTLPADTTHTIMKQGIALDTVVVPNAGTGVTAFTPPGTSGQSINYLVQAQYADSDVSIDPTSGATPVVLPFYNASNPIAPYQGPNGSGATSNTFRKGIVSLQVKAGTAAATGSQVTPTPDAGYVGLWVVSVAFGQTSIVTANIAAYPGAPFLSSSLLASIQTGNLQYGVDVSVTANVVQGSFPLPPASVSDTQPFWVKIKNANTGAVTFTPNAGVIAASPLVGAAHSALQGGELVANGRALVVWRPDITSYVLIECTGGAVQVANATQSQHAISMGQGDARYAAGLGGGFRNLTVDAVGVNNYNVVITADEVVLENSAGLFITQRTVSKTVNMNGTVGAPLSIMSARAASAWYYPWLWYNATLGLTATMDISSTAPTPPTGYSAGDYKARLPGEKYTDATAGKYPLQLRTTDYTSKYVLLAGSNVTALPQMTSGAQGNVNTPTWVAIAVGAFVPPNATKITVVLGGGSTPGGASAAPNNLYSSHSSSNPPPVTSIGQTGPQYAVTGELALESTNIYYASSAASCVMNCYKWESAR